MFLVVRMPPSTANRSPESPWVSVRSADETPTRNDCCWKIPIEAVNSAAYGGARFITQVPRCNAPGSGLASFRARLQVYHNRDMAGKIAAENPRPAAQGRSKQPAIGLLGKR